MGKSGQKQQQNVKLLFYSLLSEMEGLCELHIKWINEWKMIIFSLIRGILAKNDLYSIVTYNPKKYSIWVGITL